LRTKNQLLESARQIFAKNGFQGASVDMIAEHAGYSKGAVYSNFESKEALFLALLKERMSEEIGELRTLLSRNGSAEEIMQALEDKYRSLEKQEIWCLLATEFQLQAGRNPEFAAPFAALYRNQRRAIAELLKVLAEKMGAPVPSHLDAIATSLIALTHGIALQRAADPRAVAAATAGRSLRLFLSASLNKTPSAAHK
jgi:AcrR family transcriptional regulator